VLLPSGKNGIKTFSRQNKNGPTNAHCTIRKPWPLTRTQSSPGQLLIKDAELLLKIHKSVEFPCVTSSAIKLENRRKYAPLTPAGRDRPKLLASGNGLVSVEPTFRKSLSQGSLVRGTNFTLQLEDEMKKLEHSGQLSQSYFILRNVFLIV
jgi:hypothetical protein